MPTRLPSIPRAWARTAASALFAVAALAGPLQARAQSEASIALSVLPLASVTVIGSAAFATVGSAMSLTVVAVEAAVDGTVYLLQRASDGAKFSVKLAAQGVAGASLVAGTVVTASVIGTGVLLSAAGELIAFIPNTVGRALLHNERLS